MLSCFTCLTCPLPNALHISMPHLNASPQCSMPAPQRIAHTSIPRVAHISPRTHIAHISPHSQALLTSPHHALLTSPQRIAHIFPASTTPQILPGYSPDHKAFHASEPRQHTQPLHHLSGVLSVLCPVCLLCPVCPFGIFSTLTCCTCFACFVCLKCTQALLTSPHHALLTSPQRIAHIFPASTTPQILPGYSPNHKGFHASEPRRHTQPLHHLPGALSALCPVCLVCLADQWSGELTGSPGDRVVTG